MKHIALAGIVLSTIITLGTGIKDLQGPLMSDRVEGFAAIICGITLTALFSDEIAQEIENFQGRGK